MQASKLLILFSFSITLIFLSSCEDKLVDPAVFDHYAQYQKDSLIIENYILEHDLDAFDVEFNGVRYGVYCSITKEGTEDTDIYPTPDSKVSVTYKGYLTNGTVFDQTKEGAFFSSPLNNLIGGWQIGFSALTKGDEAILLIPSYYGYRNQETGDIPASSVLIFEVKLVDFL